MTSDTPSIDAPRRIPFIATFFSILIHPARTMRRVLDRPRDPWVIPLVLLAIVATSLDEIDIESLEQGLGDIPSAAVVVPIVLGVLLVVFGVMLGLFYLLSYVAALVGRFALDGKGSARELRSALAWGLVPQIVAVIYELPALLYWGPLAGPKTLMRISGSTISWDPGLLGTGGCGKLLLLGFLDLTFFVWYLAVTSWTIAEAHRFSVWRGLGCLILAWISPLLVILAIVIAAVMS